MTEGTATNASESALGHGLARILAGSTIALALAIASLFGLARSLGTVAEPAEPPMSSCHDGLRAIDGAGAVAEGGGFRLTALSPSSEALLVCDFAEPVAAERHPVLTLRAEAFPANHVVLLGWRRVGIDSPPPVRLQPPRGRVQTYYLGSHPQWRGRITELALYLYPQEPTGTARSLPEDALIRDLSLHADGLVARIRAMGTAWFGADPWNHRSLHTLGVHVDQLELFHLNAALFGLWGIVAAVFLALYPSRTVRGWLGVIALAALPSAGIAQGHWLASTVWQHRASVEIFGELSAVERRYRQYDGELAALADRMKALIRQEDRIFVVADEELTRQRLAYFLRPRDVFLGLPASDRLRAGDLVLIYDDETRAELARRGRVLATGGTRQVATVQRDEQALLVRVE